MITFYKVSFIFLSSFLSFWSFAHDYRDIANRYDINPPSLKCGYPAQFLENDSTIRAIIYLKEGLIDLHKLDDRTYVAEPSRRNAYIIMNFNRDTSWLNINPSVVLVVDSNIEVKVLNEFLDNLGKDITSLNMYLFGSEGRYSVVKNYRNLSNLISCGYRSLLKVQLNGQNKLRIEHSPSSIENVRFKVYEFLTVNYFGEKNIEASFWRGIKPLRLNERIKDLLKYSKENPADDNLRRELYEKERFKKMLLKFGRLKVLDKRAKIQFNFGRMSPDINAVYNLLSEINKGIYYSRNYITELNFNISYAEILSSNRYKLQREFLEISIGDLLMMDYTSYNPELEPPPPPPLAVVYY